jgi:hypothetical protein
MKASFRSRAAALLASGLVVAAVGGFGGRTASALTPDSPKVQAAVKKAVRFLAGEAHVDGRLGAKALVGLVMLKNHEKPSHPRITEAVNAIQAAVKGQEPAQIKLDSPIYTAGLAAIFLATLDAHAYAGEIDSLFRYLQYQQKPHGGWGYLDQDCGDTSMTQYGVLSAWEAKQAGCRISRESIEKAANWLLRTQDPGGGFGYHGIPAPPGVDVLIKQNGIGPTMAVAGVGSVYMCADLLNLVARAARRDEDLPPALKEVESQQPAPAAAAAAADEVGEKKLQLTPRRIKAAEARGIHYITGSSRGKRHCKMNNPEWWTFYYLYAYERYASFRELAEGRTEKEPGWYNEGAQFLLQKQEHNGSWSTAKDSPSGRVPDTAFAVLFLLRSSKRSIERAYGYGESTLVAGRGLSRETAPVAVVEGKVLPVPQWRTAAELLPILERRDADFERAIAALDQLPPNQAEMLAKNHAAVLRRLVADRSQPARLAAVNAISNGGNLDLVPALVYALGDPDLGVAAQACKALRRLCRALGAPAAAAPLSDQRRGEEIQYWKKWYLAIRPEADFDL